MMVVRLEETCPKCGSHLMIREGESSDFLACPKFPACRFTRPLPNGDLPIYQAPSPYCEKCNHTGLVPSKALGKFSGKPIPNCFSDCECKQQEDREYLYQYTPEMFDFPMSYDFYRSLCQQHSWPDPGPDRPQKQAEQAPQVVEHIHRHSDMGKKEFSQLQALIGEVKYLHEKLDGISTKKKGVHKDVI